jgi:hypothetical protein
MSTSETLAAGVAALPPNANGPATAELAVHGAAVRCTASQVGPVGVAVEKLEIRAAGAPLSNAGLAEAAKQVCGKVGYLLEPLRVIEVDGPAGQVTVRSDRPQRRGGQSAYYELTANAKREATVERYAVKDGERRRVRTPMNLTNEQLDRLTEDLAEALTTSK